jgi:hypothetical protein
MPMACEGKHTISSTSFTLTTRKQNLTQVSTMEKFVWANTLYRYDSRSWFWRRSSCSIAGHVPIKVTGVDMNSGELLSLHLSCHWYSFTLACYYQRPITKNIDDPLEWFELLARPNVVVIGDFNLPEINWPSQTLKSNHDPKMHNDLLHLIMMKW